MALDVQKIIEDGVVDAQEAADIEKDIFEDGVIDRDEANALFEINDAVTDNENDPAWPKVFCKGITAHVLEDETSPGVLDSDEETWLIEKVGAEGARIHLINGEIIEAPGFPVEIYNILGAGDAFGGGFLYGYVKGWSLYKSARLGNACGAIVVTKHGCANFMPTMPEIEKFVESYGGLD